MKMTAKGAKVTTTRGRRFPPEPLTPSEIQALLRQLSRRAPTGVRNRALIAILYRSGLRIGEALALRPGDIDAAAATINVLHGKGNRSRIVGLDAGAFELLQRWLDVRARLGIGRAQPLFCTLRGRPLGQKDVRAMLQRLRR
jgi:integrase/recombinase XerC